MHLIYISYKRVYIDNILFMEEVIQILKDS